jgi:cytoskeleton protein RodZ
LQPSAESETGSAALDTPGKQLRRGREARKLEISQIATSLRITSQVVEALERDDYEHLPSPVFVSGYIRSYARLVGLDPGLLNKQFHRLHPDAEPLTGETGETTHHQRVETAPEQDGGGSGSWVIAMVIILALAGAGVIWWVSRPPTDATVASPGASIAEEPQPGSATRSATGSGLRSSSSAAQQLGARSETSGDANTALGDDATAGSAGNASTPFGGSPQSEAPEESPATALASSSDVVVLATDAAIDAPPGQTGAPRALTSSESLSTAASGRASAAGEDAPGAEQSGNLLPVPSAPEPADDASPALDPTGAEAITEAATEAAIDPDSAEPATQAVELAFSGPCWVDIRDSLGEVLLFGEMSRGAREQLGGTPPYSLVIGNAAAVELTVAGQPFDLNAVARGNVARLKLDPAEFTAAENATNAGTRATTNADAGADTGTGAER